MANEITPQNAVQELLKRLPDFAAARANDESFISHDDDSPYLVFGDLARFMINLITREPNSPQASGTLAEAFRLLNEMAVSPDREVANLAEAGVFEELTDRPETVLAARESLSGRALDVFERVVDLWAPKHKLTEQ
jgi:hypothetical protein